MKPRGQRGSTETSEAENPPTPLAELCLYYLDCLSHDDHGGVSEFAESKFPKYFELPTVTVPDTGTSPLAVPEAQRVLAEARKNHNLDAYIGYPVRLSLVRSRKSDWSGFMVQPLILTRLRDKGGDESGDEPLLINFRALRLLVEGGESNLLEEAAQLSEELGIGADETAQSDLGALAGRLRAARAHWDWREDINPDALSSGPPLGGIRQPGIYNRAVLVTMERPTYTRGLETELRALAAMPKKDYSRTALGRWLSRPDVATDATKSTPLLEVLPLNIEQYSAVQQALSSPLTVITGPPGTGKSQVVTSILINAAWRGQRVLFASKNNKAVDVVETRLNALASRPVLLRLGANEHQARVAEYLTSLLRAPTSEDSVPHDQLMKAHQKRQGRLAALDSQMTELVDQRNLVDHLEQETEALREVLGSDLFARAREIDTGALRDQIPNVELAIGSADRSKQPLFARFFWPLLRRSRFVLLEEAMDSLASEFARIDLDSQQGDLTDATLERWYAFAGQIPGRLDDIDKTRRYFDALACLDETRSLEELDRKRRDLARELATSSEELWQSWIRSQPSRLTRSERDQLGDLSSLLQLFAEGTSNRESFEKYQELYKGVAQTVFPCWAVTLLSARGRIPLSPNFFDLLVVDEASQCDIASALPLLLRSRRVVVIGDPMQLRHISALNRQNDRRLLAKHDLLTYHASWAYSTRSLFDVASSLSRGEDIVTLRDHHRSHQDIISFSNDAFYDSRLRVATRHENLRRPSLDEPAVRWIDVGGKTVRPGGGSAVNDTEARAVVVEIKRLVDQGYRGTIGVVSPFAAQATRIRDLFYGDPGLSAHADSMDFLVDTVHKFQGDERDVMIFSPTISAEVSPGALDFLRANPNLFNVAVTRARAALIVVGDKTAALGSGVEYLSKFASYADRIDAESRATDPVQPRDLGPAFPEVANPHEVSDWEERLYRVLYEAGVRPVPQYPADRYKLDFAVVNGSRRLDIEVDGELYHRDWDGELCRRDQIRNQRLMELGWDVMRFWVYQLRDEMPSCVERVRRWIGEPSDEVAPTASPQSQLRTLPDETGP